MENALTKVVNDKDTLELIAIAEKYRCVELYILHGHDSPTLQPTDPPIQETHFEPLLNENDILNGNESPVQNESKKSPPKAKKLPLKRAPAALHLPPSNSI